MDDPKDETIEELSGKINDIMRHGDPSMREMLRDLIREFHHQVMTDPKALAGMKNKLKAMGRKIVQLPLDMGNKEGREKPGKPARFPWKPAAILSVLVALIAFISWRQLANTSSQTPPTRICDIKGNINPNGERIYHVRGDEWYEKTIVDGGRGERWFCSEPEARAEGWRRALH
ncbi:MAG: hypothetical protein HY579_01430 [Nitrospinae bacterium]|nr:hypothetical protein [Nitrospinota bacterium]